MKKTSNLLIIFLFGFFSITCAQYKTMNVWTGKIPGAIENPNYIEVTDSKDNWTKIRMVTNPTLDFYPAKREESNGTAVIICPGGGYWGLAVLHEGKMVAEWFNSIGISAFVLKYRLPDSTIMKDKSIGPLQDAQEAVRFIRRHANEWNIDQHKIGIMGFSAGGHLASTLSTHFSEKVYESVDSVSARPDFSILIYPVISMESDITHKGSRFFLLGNQPTEKKVDHFSNDMQVDSTTPPAFLIHSLDDNVVPFMNSVNYALALKKYNIPCELHLYEKGGHGYGLGRTDGTESSWSEACEKWLLTKGYCKLEK